MSLRCHLALPTSDNGFDHLLGIVCRSSRLNALNMDMLMVARIALEPEVLGEDGVVGADHPLLQEES